MRTSALIALATASVFSQAAFGQTLNSSIFQNHATQLQTKSKRDLYGLPSNDTTNYLKSLKAQIDSQRAVSGVNTARTPGVEAAITRENNNEPAGLIPDQLLIRVRPDLSPAEINEVLNEYGMRAIEVYPGIGTINTQVDLSQFGDVQTSPNEAMRIAVQAANRFLEDDRIVAASPNFAVAPKKNAKTVMSPIPDANLVTTMTVEKTGWGIDDIQAPALWTDARSQNGTLVGVMDVGFSFHDDLTFNGLPAGAPAHDHGNHVAGIICAKHDNEKGIKGVLPSCQVRAKSGDFLPIAPEGGEVSAFLLTFAQILSSFDEFVSDHDEIDAFNASLGYNWIPNFGINPENDDDLKARVQSQAVFLFPVLKVASERDVILLSAAGNDSTTLDPPMNAIWASPFNYAAKFSCEIENICSGVVVEAHDETGKRAAFSNRGGDVSCPGTNVISTLAFDQMGAPSREFYGEMSGTSMASPFCTGGVVLLSLLRPNYTKQKLVECVIASGIASKDSGTPMMKLADALEECPAR